MNSTAQLPTTEPSDPLLELRSISATYLENRRRLPVLREIGFSVAAGEFVSLIGPSGSGKSTLLDLVAGLLEPDAGEIRFGGRPLAANERLGRSAYMHQRDLLLPWRNALDNVGLALEAKGARRKAARSAAAGLLESFGLSRFAASYPTGLSGGMRQRVAFLRTVVTGSPLLLLDEPFGALDAFTRVETQDWLVELLAREPRTVLFVTHDVEEAIFLADRVIVLSPLPASVGAVLPVPFPRPREREIVTSPAFIALREEAMRALGLTGHAKRRGDDRGA
jgi:ABC-type nitrate/sulfonate/bicarbonate transport system ATPase subunit